MARYIAQACDIPNKVRNLVTVGAPNMGFSDPPKCQPFADKLLSKLINQNTEDEDNGTLSNVFMQRYA